MKNMNICQVSFIIQKSEEEITGSVSSKTMPYNKLLTNLACSSRTGEYWPSVVFVRTSLRSVRTATTLGQYSPVRPSRSVSKRLIFFRLGTINTVEPLLSTHLLKGNLCSVASNQCRDGGFCIIFTITISIFLRVTI